jgi:adenylate cyclase
VSARDSERKDAQATMRMLQHEVRTPLGHIIGYSEMLEEDVLDLEQPQLIADLHKIQRAARRLLDLVDGKLRTDPTDEISRLEGGEAAVAQPDESEAEQASELSESRVLDRGSVLIVDGDIDSRDLLARKLREGGYGVETASDGIDALRRIEEGSSDLVVLDVLLPGMNGLEVLERIRRSRSMSELPVVLVSSLDAPEDTIEGLDRGGNDFVVKPFDPGVLVARIEAQLTAHRSARQVAALARQLEFRNAFMSQALGRQMSEDLLVELSERPDASALGGERKPVTAIVVDIRNTRSWMQTLSPEDVFAVLNNVFGPLSDVVDRYRGAVEAIAGDSMIALFGLPVPRENDVEHAVACGVALLLETSRVNTRNRRAGLPDVEIGVGIASGDVLVGGIGRGEGLRLAALGDPALHAARIERIARPGQLVICDRTREAAGDSLEIVEEARVVLSEGEPAELIHRVVGVGGGELISVRSDSDRP